MYDYYLGERADVLRDGQRYLLEVKHLLPKWLNGIPDAAMVAIHALLEEAGRRAAAAGRPLIVVETGGGASTIALIYAALKYGGLAYTWEPNVEKASQIRTVCTETLGQIFPQGLQERWRLVPSGSTAANLGLEILRDLTDHVDYFFHDGEHIWTTLRKELEAVEPLLVEGGVVAVDDAQYDFLHTNEFIVNVIRRKLGLPAVTFPENRGQPFYEAVEQFLAGRWARVDNVAGLYRERYRDDPYYAYYQADTNVRKVISSSGHTAQEHRFEAWQVTERRQARGGRRS